MEKLQYANNYIGIKTSLLAILKSNHFRRYGIQTKLISFLISSKMIYRKIQLAILVNFLKVVEKGAKYVIEK